MNIFLTGYRATGKSTVAQQIAEQLEMQWMDSDALIEQTAEMSIADIFSSESEVGFRDWETIIVRQLAAGENQVVSLGGGAVLRPENQQALRGRGLIVWLQASADIIYDRLRKDPNTRLQRPALTAESGLDEIRTLLEQRLPVYESVSDFSVDTDLLSPLEVATQIMDRIG